jgi:UDP-N-acetylmuramoyl-L-alanyl-D-glutamate--2,6-diaminopimelate ligase
MRTETMKIDELFGELERRGMVVVPGLRDREVTGLSIDSRRVRPGDLFAALAGPKSDGHRFAGAAAAAGAAALLVEKGKVEAGAAGPVLVETDDVRDVLGKVADRFYGRPSTETEVFGVTGTNGKTSVTYLLESLLRAAGRSVGVMGTIDYRWGGKSERAASTTPESTELQRVLRAMADDGVEAVAMEVSSHSLAQRRLDGCAVPVAIFTNLSRDHLDFHRDMEDYFLAKARLFTDFSPALSVINGDDPWGERLLGMSSGRVITYGLKDGSDYSARSIVSDASGLRFRLRTPRDEFEAESPLLGMHNVYNILAAAAAALESGLDGNAVREGIRAAARIPGRFDLVSSESGRTVLVDYAHTPDALDYALRSARTVAGGSLILVFGCGGDRDRGKRPLMGAAAARLADVTFLTSDNPRSEEPMEILRQVETGFREVDRRRDRLHMIPDRRRAIRAALESAAAGDVVLIAGKGHEDYQEFSDKVVHFSDFEEAREALRDAGR